jgi:hypothetical protein
MFILLLWVLIPCGLEVNTSIPKKYTVCIYRPENGDVCFAKMCLIFLQVHASSEAHPAFYSLGNMGPFADDGIV